MIFCVKDYSSLHFLSADGAAIGCTIFGLEPEGLKNSVCVTVCVNIEADVGEGSREFRHISPGLFKTRFLIAE